MKLDILTAVQENILLEIAGKKFLRGSTTMELMGQASSEDERYLVAVVSLLEVDAASRFSGLTVREANSIKRYHRFIESYLADRDAEQSVAA